MSKDKISDYSTTASDNTDIAGIGILGTNAVRNFDDAFRTLMKQLADMNAGTSPIFDTFTLCDPVATTKRFRLDGGGITTGATRVMTFPDADFTPVKKAGDTGLGSMTLGGASVFSAISDSGTIELCSTLPYIDIKNNAGDDYDVRLSMDGATNSFTVSASGGQKINGNVAWHAGLATSGSGWNRLPNGLLFQTGAPVVTLSAFGTGIATLPTAFTSSSSYIVVVSNGDASVNLQYQLVVSGGYPSATQFAFQGTKSDGTYQNGGNVRINFIAIGT